LPLCNSVSSVVKAFCTGEIADDQKACGSGHSTSRMISDVESRNFAGAGDPKPEEIPRGASVRPA
jgi:hypothetical protein